jgi:hypothetical protein
MTPVEPGNSEPHSSLVVGASVISATGPIIRPAKNFDPLTPKGHAFVFDHTSRWLAHLAFDPLFHRDIGTDH